MRRYKGMGAAVRQAFLEDADRPLDNADLYRRVAVQLSLDLDEAARPEPMGQAGAPRSRFERQVRWAQQTLRMRGLLERAGGRRGEWKLTEMGKHRLRRIDAGTMLVAFSTDLGIAILGDCRTAFSAMSNDPIHLTLTSPPYPIAKGRAYGTVTAEAYVDFICGALDPLVARLARGGSVVLNIGNDVFEPGTPARSLYQERLVLALNDRLGLSLMDRLVWHNPSKPPGPVQWASVRRFHLKGSYEPVLWFSNDPLSSFADNRRVLLPHSPRHQRFLATGGGGAGTAADGAHKKRSTSYSTPSPGRIPDNVLAFSHSCAGQNSYKAAARSHGIAPHGAPFPERLVEFLVRYLTEDGMLVADPFAGSQTTGAVCERLDRRWLTSEVISDYVRGGMSRFRRAAGLWINPDLDFA